MKVHFIAIGGSIMHNLAIALKGNGYEVTGSDDHIYEPAKTNLRNFDLLPDQNGWFPKKISDDLDMVILGMHARKDNPELQKAIEKQIRIYSFPEYIYEQAKDKTRVVISGSHGKTTITSMIMHVLKFAGKDFDYMAGASIKGFERMVKITPEAPVIIIEGDEYLTSALDSRPKFLHYKPHIALLSGIAWDHINAFPSYEKYLDLFYRLKDSIEEKGCLIYNKEDAEVLKVVNSTGGDVSVIGYKTPASVTDKGKVHLIAGDSQIPLNVFGDHNLMNLQGARLVCEKLGIPGHVFLDAIATFEGAANRLEKIGENGTTLVYKDFAHSPSKVKATAHAMKQFHPNRKLTACFELHTYSSLNREFLKEYRNTMSGADNKLIFLDSHALLIKKMTLSADDIHAAFEDPEIKVFTDNKKLFDYLIHQNWNEHNLLMMSSGSFGGMDLKELTKFVIDKEN